ncbi:MAG: tRNA 2-thiocytidine(32) synthetase TtcA [Candidatus Omnitrophica bacterium]|nr:tRNA 2-thiocytidine(32) synthetase TtcA [Candidatus Omnitrophota bacterium]
MMLTETEEKTKIEKPQGPEYYISKKVGRAIIDYALISDGDKIAVAVSGGKDSLTLLKVLADRRSFVPIKYDLLAVHIDLGYPHTHSKLLARYLEREGFRYYIEKIDVLKEKKRNDISCFWCSWNRRKALFEVAHRLGFKKIALGHHKDDIIQTVLLNLFFQGEISAMRPKQELFKGEITLIRPLAYVEEEEIIRFAKTQNFPPQKYRCPHSLTSRRAKMEKIIKELEKINSSVKTNIFRAIKRINKEYLL